MASSEPSDPLARLQRWYLSQCNGDWEHGYGVNIGTLDNPGWTIDIHLEGTDLEGRTFAPIDRGCDVPEPNHDWIQCRVEGTTFTAAGGPEKLAEMLRIFLDWAESE